MKRNTVRLTESQLHRVIKESVNKVLTELDWKTYANAARKWSSHLMQHPDDPRRKSSIMGHEHSKGNHDIHTDDRLRGFTDAMRGEFNKEYGFNSVDSPEVKKNGLKVRDDSGYYEMPFDTDNIGAKGYYDYLASETGTQRPKKAPFIPHTLRDEFDMPTQYGDTSSEPHRAYNVSGAWNKTRRYDRKPVEPEYDDSNFKYMKARNKGNQAIHDYISGKSHYTKGKGWE